MAISATVLDQAEHLRGQFFTRTELSRLVGMSFHLVDQWVKNDLVETVLIGRHLYISGDSVATLLGK